MSVSNIITTNSVLPWKQINCHSITTDSIITSTINSGSLNVDGEISATNLSPHTWNAFISDTGAKSQEFGSLIGNSVLQSTGFYRVTWSSMLPRDPKSIIVCAHQGNGTSLVKFAYVVFSNRNYFEYRTEGSSGLLSGYCSVSVVV